MTEHKLSATVRVHHGDCLEVLRTMPECSIDAVVTDPPYGLSFMGKKWDYDVPSVEIWAECLRVLKPGGHLLAFAGTRTQHRMAVRIEDAGFEIRDMIAWVYGSGFPKSLDVSKAIDRAAGVERERVAGPKSGGMAALNRGNAAHGYRDVAYYDDGNMMLSNEPATDAARQWQGWGTALKPALEPITMARKPLIGTVAANVLAHGTGALNIDKCRVATDDNLNGGAYAKEGNRSESQSLHAGSGMNVAGKTVGREFEQPVGRWPANLIHDGSDEVTELLPVTGPSKSSPRNNGEFKSVAKGRDLPHVTHGHDDDGGSAARFFYCAKASKRDREEGNKHPTVKPTDLMRYLCRLVTPPRGIVLDPFMGSGSTGKAAVMEHFAFVGIEREAESIETAKARIAMAVEGVGLFPL